MEQIRIRSKFVRFDSKICDLIDSKGQIIFEKFDKNQFKIRSIWFDSNYRVRSNFWEDGFVRNSLDSIQTFTIRLIRKVKKYLKNSIKINSKFVWFSSTPPLCRFIQIAWFKHYSQRFECHAIQIPWLTFHNKRKPIEWMDKKSSSTDIRTLKEDRIGVKKKIVVQKQDFISLCGRCNHILDWMKRWVCLNSQLSMMSDMTFDFNCQTTILQNI